MPDQLEGGLYHQRTKRDFYLVQEVVRRLSITLTRPDRKTSDLPLAVWPCAQKTSQWQRYRRYVPDSNRHPAKMLPVLARRAIETYSDPGDLVVDPMCGIGTTLVEAADLGRRTVGIELEPRWSKLATANLDHALPDHERALARVIEGDARALPRLLTTNAQDLLTCTTRHSPKLACMAYGRVDLILTSPPYACEIADVCPDVRNKSEPLRRHDTTNYSPDRRNLGHARGDTYLTAMSEIYRVCAAALRPGGFLVCVTKDMRARGALRNLSGDTISLCESAGLVYWQHVIGLLATIRDAELVMRPSLWQTLHVRRYRAQGDRTQVVAHEDVLVFRKPRSRQAGRVAKGDAASTSRARERAA